VRALRAGRAAAAAAATGAAALAIFAASPAQASAVRCCAGPDKLSVAEKDRLFRFGAVVKQTLESSGHSLALIARSGLDLSRFGQRYSHAGISLQASENTPWSVRQLYYACDESKPRIYDQGIAGFVLGTDEPAVGYISLLLLPEGESQALERTALDKQQALQMLSASYSANAYPFSVQYQNCNQWVMEVLALAWGGVPINANARAASQAWLKSSGYEPTVMNVGWRALMWLGTAMPWVNNDDHPAADLAQAFYRVSMPASMQAFVQARSPQAQRLELCHNDKHIVVHRGWEAIAEGCVPAEGDTVIALD
jgi:hypothetical protein